MGTSKETSQKKDIIGKNHKMKVVICFFLTITLVAARDPTRFKMVLDEFCDAFRNVASQPKEMYKALDNAFPNAPREEPLEDPFAVPDFPLFPEHRGKQVWRVEKEEEAKRIEEIIERTERRVVKKEEKRIEDMMIWGIEDEDEIPSEYRFTTTQDDLLCLLQICRVKTRSNE